MKHTLDNISVSSLAKMIQTKNITPIEVVHAFFEKIENTNPAIDAWEILNKEEAIAKASSIEKKILRKQPLGLLCGIPYAAKDIIFTKNLATTASSALKTSFIPRASATVITNLENEDAILLGKTKTAEFAYGRTSLTANPWNVTHSAGGSSSGSAAAVSADMASFSIGSQTGGSLLRPASFCGLVSMKPTLGRISTRHVFPVSWTLDHLGPMTKTVRDQALVLHVLSGFDFHNPPSLNVKKINHTIPTLKNLKGIRIGLPNTYFFDDLQPSVAIALKSSIDTLRYLGADIIECTLPSSFDAANAAHPIIMMAEASSYHAKNFEKSQHSYTKSVQEQLASGNIIPSSSYIKSLHIRKLFIQELIEMFQKTDILLTPSVPTTAPLKGITGDPKFNSIFTLAGVPALTIPCGIDEHSLPIGLQLVGKAFSEELLLSVALAFEKTFSLYERNECDDI